MTLIYIYVSMIFQLFTQGGNMEGFALLLNNQLHTNVNGWFFWFVGCLIAIVIDKVLWNLK